MKSVIYWHPLIYRIAMRLLYGGGYSDLCKKVAKETKGVPVLDLCCGVGKLAKYVNNYSGADSNDVFVKDGRKRGLNIVQMDIIKDDIPESECIVIMESLYQFYPSHKQLIRNLKKKAKKLIISESGVHLADSRNSLVKYFAKHMTNTSKKNNYRFTKIELQNLFHSLKAAKIIDAGRSIIGVFER